MKEADRNFIIKNYIDEPSIRFYDAEESPFRIHGIFREGDRFRRISEEVAKATSEGVYLKHTNTSGGRVRFVTDSDYVAIRVNVDGIMHRPHMTLCLSAGFDIYAKEAGRQCYKGTFMPPADIVEGYESIVRFDSREMREITVNFPLYGDVKKLHIGLNQEAQILPAEDYAVTKPIVYYGSSITQGGCASRPGTCYQHILSHRLDCDFVNLGFSGNAKGEAVMAEYIADMEMSAFVYDYDHNAPTLEHLQKTHEPFFKIIRGKNPDLPVLMLSRPKWAQTEEEQNRLAIIKATCENALSAGDKNVYLLSGRQLMELVETDGNLDGVHPTDSGFLSMANAMEPVLRKILG